MISQIFTDRTGGISEGPFTSFNLASHVGDDPRSVAANRYKLSQRSGPVVFMNQSHGTTVALVDGIPAGEPNADAMVTTEPGIALAVLVADCIPLLLRDEGGACIAAVHVGRRGLMSGIASKVIHLMHELGAESLHAMLGPSICGNCYEVGEDIHADVVNKYPSAHSTTEKFAFALDLPGALTQELQEVGITVVRSNICSFESPEHFSYRRDGQTGRNAGVIWM